MSSPPRLYPTDLSDAEWHTLRAAGYSREEIEGLGEVFGQVTRDGSTICSN
ncbi:MAG: hypothetical protein ACR2JC_21415 [Chloroflexota bacterium]